MSLLVADKKHKCIRKIDESLVIKKIEKSLKCKIIDYELLKNKGQCTTVYKFNCDNKLYFVKLYYENYISFHKRAALRKKLTLPDGNFSRTLTLFGNYHVSINFWNESELTLENCVSPEELIKCGKSVAQELKEIHSTKFSKADIIFWKYKQCIKYLSIKKVVKKNRIMCEMYKTMRAIAKEIKLNFSVVHADLFRKNIMLDKGQNKWHVIDYESVRIGYIEEDIVAMASNINILYPMFFSFIEDYYGDNIPKDFWKHIYFAITDLCLSKVRQNSIEIDFIQDILYNYSEQNCYIPKWYDYYHEQYIQQKNKCIEE